MRKLLAILLIATIACNGLAETFEDNIFDYLDLDKEAIELGFFDFLGKLWNKVKGVVDWLKQKGWWDTIVKVAKTVGKYAAKKLCEKYAKSSKCGDIVDKFLGK